MTYHKLIYGAIVLFAANLFNRFLGFLYQYLVMHYIGSEAYGLYYMVFPLYMTALVLATAGLPLAISKMVAEKMSLNLFQEAQRVLKISLVILFTSGLLVSAVLFSQSALIVNTFFADDRVFRIFQICVPSIFIVAIASAFRGYFQGMQNMIPSALSQVAEQLTRVSIGFALSYMLLNRGAEWAAAGLAAGMLSGEIVGLLMIGIQYVLFRHKIKSPRQKKQASAGSILANLFTLSLPITGGRLVSTGLSSLETMIIPRQLQAAGYTVGSATSLFGQLSGTAVTLLTFPSVFTFALATSLVPAISEAMVRNDLPLARSCCSDAVRYTMILGVPCVVLLNVFAEPLTHLFKSDEVAVVLKVLTFGGLFAYLQQTTTGILQGLGKTSLPLINSLLSAVIRIPLLYYLTGLPKWGILGTSLSFNIGFIIMAVLNLSAIRRQIGFKFNFKTFLFQPLAAGFVLAGICKLFMLITPANIIWWLVSVVVGLSVYLVILILIGNISPNELKRIPFLKKIIP